MSPDKNRYAAPVRKQAVSLIQEGTVMVNCESIYAVLFYFVPSTILWYNVQQPLDINGQSVLSPALI